MLGDISGLEKIYIVCGYTDMRKSIDGLCAIVEEQLKLDAKSSALFSVLRTAQRSDQGSIP